jgi:hypothetical protein
MQAQRTGQRSLRRIAPGIYETQDGRSRVIRTAGLYEGPQGGQRDMWEIVHMERDAWVPDGPAYRTLKEARRYADEQPAHHEDASRRNAQTAPTSCWRARCADSSGGGPDFGDPTGSP